MKARPTADADALLGAEFKFRIPKDAREKLEAIAAARQATNSGFRLSDAGREALTEFIEFHLRPESAILREEPAFRERRCVPRRSPLGTETTARRAA
jgi:hypothetical protein